MIVGCYSLHLYCDTPDCPSRIPHVSPDWETTAEFGSECRQEARKLGWKLNVKNNQAWCPKCAEIPKLEK